MLPGPQDPVDLHLSDDIVLVQISKPTQGFSICLLLRSLYNKLPNEAKIGGKFEMPSRLFDVPNFFQKDMGRGDVDVRNGGVDGGTCDDCPLQAISQRLLLWARGPIYSIFRLFLYFIGALLKNKLLLSLTTHIATT